MDSPLTPTHLLFFDEPFAHDLINGGFHKPRRDPFAMAIPIPVIGDEGLVGRNVAAEFTHRAQQFFPRIGRPFNRVEISFEIAHPLYRSADIAVPQVPLDPFQALLDFRAIGTSPSPSEERELTPETNPLTSCPMTVNRMVT